MIAITQNEECTKKGGYENELESAGSIICSQKCECDKIEWNFDTFVHHYKENDEILNQDTSCDCQSKSARGEMTMEEYTNICKKP